MKNTHFFYKIEKKHHICMGFQLLAKDFPVGSKPLLMLPLVRSVSGTENRLHQIKVQRKHNGVPTRY